MQARGRRYSAELSRVAYGGRHVFANIKVTQGRRLAFRLPSELPLPLMERAELARQMRTLCAADAEIARRKRYLILPSRGLWRGCVITDEASRRAAEAAGLHVMGRANPADFLAALQQVFGPQLARDAALKLARERPALSAHRRFSDGQAKLLAMLVPAMAGLLAFSPATFCALVNVCFGLLFLLLASLHFTAVRHKPRSLDAPLLHNAELPVYTILVPLYREARVVAQLLRALGRLNYPPERLDIKLLVEADDGETRDALAEWVLPEHMEILVVPAGAPRTKPRALNYGLAFARGELVTIFDAEDVPHPAQLRVAASMLAQAPENLACLQAPLAWYNADSSFFTRMIAIDYASHFHVVLPCLAALGLPLPLGGTSNHFRFRALRDVGGWDPFNVTEDADLGLRLARFGWQTGVLPRVGTLEEACTTYQGWRHQRARWIKGWLQTFLVHQRHPRDLLRRGGLKAFYTLHALLGSGVFAALLHPFFLGWVIMSLSSGPVPVTWQQAWLLALSLVVLIAGHGAALAAAITGIRRTRQERLLPWLALLPFYWLLISLAAWQALVDFIRMPHHWRKTSHGHELLLR